MPKGKGSGNGDGERVYDLRHPDAKRKNIPPAGLEARGKIVRERRLEYAYNPHLPPVLRFDATGKADALPELVEKAGREPLTAEEQRVIAKALRNHEPWLEWTGKREQHACVVDPVALHIHERVAAKAILATAARQDIPRSLFADPEQEYREAVQFYQHDVDWSNRLILGDSLMVMASLARREALAGKVQMIYMDPPYGIKYASNFQPEVGKRDVKDKEEDLTRESEMVKAYRDTWTLGTHSYLSYLRDRLLLAKELLADSGSIFVQISNENIHRMRCLLDAVFGPENACGTIHYKSTTGQTSDLLSEVGDYLLWYSKDVSKVKFRPLFTDKPTSEPSISNKYVEEKSGERRTLSTFVMDAYDSDAEGTRLFALDNITSQSGGDNSRFPVPIDGRELVPEHGFWKTNPSGMDRLGAAQRLGISGKTLRYVRFAGDFSVSPVSSLWTDTSTGSFTEAKVYVVQTNLKIVSRCLLMTTDPGDLVLDPTCGSGTTAYVAEQWGRRWISVDCSRVAVAIARQRLLTAKYDFYRLRSVSAEDLERNPNGTWLTDSTKQIQAACSFECKTVPHVTLKSIAQNQALDGVFAKWDPILADKLKAANAALAAANTLELRTRLLAKLDAKRKLKDKENPVTDTDERRWRLPPDLPKRKDYTTVDKGFAGWYEWEVPFDTDPDWPKALQDAVTEYRKAWRAKMDEVNACIAARAEQEELVDKPEVDKSILRVCGPFTVEGVIPSEESVDMEPEESPIGGGPEELEAFGGESAGSTFEEGKSEPQNAEAYVDRIIRLLREDGVRFLDNGALKFSRLERYPVPGLHAEGEWQTQSGERTVAVVIAPQYGSLTAKMVEEGIRFAVKRGFDDLVFAGFSFDGAAQAAIQDDPDPHLRIHMAQIRPDVNMGDLLKTTASSQIFTVSGTPRTRLDELPDGELQVVMEGVDIYDPVTNSVRPTGAEKVAAWFVDGDYDSRCFCITQAFFPDKKAWEKLSKALTGKVDPERFEAFSGTVSLPFPKGKHGRVAVKVIDPRGNEVMRVHKVGGAYGDRAE